MIPDKRVLWLALLAAAVPFGHLIDNGYSFFNAEVIIITLGFAVTGALLGYVSSNRWIYGLVFCLTLFVFLDVYIVSSRTVPIVAAAVVCLALLLFFDKLKSTAVPGVAVAALAFSVAGILNPDTLPPDRPLAPPSERVSKRPGILHVVFDEFGSPTTIKNGMPGGHQAQNFVDQLVSKGFYVYENAHSVSAHTFVSLGAVFGMTDLKDNFVKNPSGSTFSYAVKKNQLVEQLEAAGYSTKAHQVDFLAICSTENLYGCKTYTRSAQMSVFTDMGLDFGNRIGLALLSMHNDYILKKSVRRVWLYRFAARNVFGALQEYGFFSTPIAVLNLVKKLEAEVPHHPSGTVAFHHFLAPHYPLILDENCKLKPIREWRYPRRNEKRKATDEQIYMGYWDQAACIGTHALRIADAAQAGNNPIIVIHGDHGSRLMSGTAKQNTDEHLSTFLAIRAPGLSAGRSAAPVKLNEKIREFYDRVLKDP